MNTATLTPKFIDPPQDGKKNYKVKDTNNVVWFVPPDTIGKMAKGTPCTVEYDVNNFNGKSFNMVKGVVGQPQQSPTIPFPPAIPTVPTFVSADPTPERIYVCGIVNAHVGSSNRMVTVSELIAVTNAAREAWAATFGGQAKPKADLDDDIPI